MKYSNIIPSKVTEWMTKHPFSADNFVFSWHALAAKYRDYPEAVLPLRKKSRFNGAVAYAWREEASRMGGKDWTVRMRKSGHKCDYIIVAAPLPDGRYCVVSYWPVRPGAPDTEDYTTGQTYVPDHVAHGPRPVK